MGPQPNRFDIDKLLTFQTGVAFDDKPLFKKFGSVMDNDIGGVYLVGKTPSVSFWGGHPKNNFWDVKSYCDVEKKDSSGNFVTVMQDSHWDVRFRWERKFASYSNSTCEWYIRPNGEHTKGE